MLNLEKSKQLYKRAIEIIPGGTNTISKRVDSFLGADHFPAYIVKARDAHVWDADGYKYIDYIAALAPISIGYNNPRIVKRIKRQLEDGVLFSLPSPVEIELSEILIDKIPCAEMVRLVKTGAEATSAAIRAARLHSGKDVILSCGYHGWHDWYAAKNGTRGIPGFNSDLIFDFKFNDFEMLQKLVDEHKNKIAGIILTPALYGVNPQDGFLTKIRKLADENQIILIFDEIITGFRWAIGGAQEKFGVTPDLATFGKSMANGMPIAALVGKKEFMAPLKDNWISSTYSSEALSIAAALESIAILEEEKIIDKLYKIAHQLHQGLQEISKNLNLKIAVHEPVPALKFKFELENNADLNQFNFEFMKSCAENGILIRKEGDGFSLCLMAALTKDDLEYTLEIIEQSARSIAHGA